jgi:O-antigen ligase
MLSRFNPDVLMDSREGVWEASIESWREQPWFGKGYGVTSSGYAINDISNSIGSVRDGAGYFGVLESVGVIGLSALLVLYGTVARNVWILTHVKRRGSVGWHLATLGGTLFLALAVNAAAEAWIMGPGAFAQHIMWFALGLHVAGMRGYHGMQKHTQNGLCYGVRYV